MTQCFNITSIRIVFFFFIAICVVSNDYINIRACIQCIDAQTRTQEHMHVLVHLHTYTYSNTHQHIHTHKHTHTHTHTHMHMHTHTFKQFHTPTHIHRHVFTSVYTIILWAIILGDLFICKHLFKFTSQTYLLYICQVSQHSSLVYLPV